MECGQADYNRQSAEADLHSRPAGLSATANKWTSHDKSGFMIPATVDAAHLSPNRFNGAKHGKTSVRQVWTPLEMDAFRQRRTAQFRDEVYGTASTQRQPLLHQRV